MRLPSQVKLDVLAWEPARTVVAWRGFPLGLQAVALAVVLTLVAAGLDIGPGMSAESLMTLRKTNLATLVVWGLWWPGMVAVAIALGRVWCTVCPMELVNRIGDSAARRAGWPRARLGRVLRDGWIVVALYVTLQLLVAGLAIHRVPHFTALLLLMLIGGALVTGSLFREPRSFCRSFCPAAALLSVYGRQTPLQLEMRDTSVCQRCATRDCVRAENRYRLDARSCPSLLRPFGRQASDGCVVCFQCAKICPHDNVGFGLVADTAPIRRRSLLLPYEAAFVMIALGFVAHEVAGEARWLDGTFHAVPAALGRLVPIVPFGWVEAVWFLGLFPLVVWALIGAVGYAVGFRGGLRSLLLAAATGAAPIVAMAHLAKAMAKVASWGGFLPLALRDPHGLGTLRRVAEGSLPAPASLLGLPVVGWAMLALIFVVASRTLRWAWQMPVESMPAARAGAAGATALFAGLVAAWSWPGL